MDSFNIYKGYGQLTHLEDQDSTKTTHLPNNPRKPLISISIISIILLSLLVGSIVAALIYRSQTEAREDELGLDSSSSSAFNSATRSIQLVCNVTQYPDSCFSTLSAINTQSKPDPEFLFSLSLQAAIRELSKLESFPDSLSSPVSDSRTQSALDDCRSLFADALDRLNQSAAAAKGHVASSHGVKISDINTWISAAMTDEETCLDGLEEVGSSVVDEVKAKVHASKVCLSNSLAILSNIKNLVEKFHRPVSGRQLGDNNHM
uniref:pectinesterase n=1 Tax=Opuntia streptacantha TaxID=393608 RepID=A0A7C9E120_OPUST